ncbi:hypothetical protein OG349_02255 [Streptomyces sp. NBC_01317]|nr:hypothetical protein OG349_02255 [Streptomyces sp. NBC_01317]
MNKSAHERTGVDPAIVDTMYGDTGVDRSLQRAVDILSLADKG